MKEALRISLSPPSGEFTPATIRLGKLNDKEASVLVDAMMMVMKHMMPHESLEVVAYNLTHDNENFEPVMVH